MKNNTSLAIFETHKIRRHYDEKTETWYFSVIDIVAALTEQMDFKKAKSYWTTLKGRLKLEGSELVTKCDQLKLLSADGKFYKTDSDNRGQLLTKEKSHETIEIIESISTMPDLQQLTQAIIKFRDERDWKPFHKPTDMVISLMLEAAEVAEL